MMEVSVEVNRQLQCSREGKATRISPTDVRIPGCGVYMRCALDLVQLSALPRFEHQDMQEYQECLVY